MVKPLFVVLTDILPVGNHMLISYKECGWELLLSKLLRILF
jgi:hypothetical protein